MNYLQKKKQAIIMMLAAQIIKTAQGYPVTVNDCESGTAVDYTVWGNTVADGDTVMYVGDKTLVSDNTYKYKIPIVNLGKNIISYPFSKLNNTSTLNGIKFTDNGDGTITANGTAKGEVWFKYADNIKSITGKYTLSGCPSGGSVQTYLMQISNVDRKTGKLISSFRCYNDTDVGYENLSFDENNIAWGYIYIKTGVTVENLTFKPQLELGETATEYEPYRVPVTANIYLDEPLKKGESINFGADNLPGLQLFEGSNVITADTAVKPSDIEIRYTVKQ